MPNTAGIVPGRILEGIAETTIDIGQPFGLQLPPIPTTIGKPESITMAWLVNRVC